ncbi:RDD family protein [Montanilutibacter psychrotolerans]|uniref:RDD family protein n=1 Tax=Montanilutibacter psychrotolerans TaxID=1327343 RepID=A0A3M8SV32_9GAMM|nr:RDD family protein [Lysobacter psychrotolerans]RNF85159.1 RDD family protein [Lysobacter psychrotolerans]
MDELNPYQAPAAPVSAVDGESVHALADRGERLAAVLIDAVISIVVMLPVMFLAGYFDMVRANADAGRILLPLGQILLWAAIGFLGFVLIQGIPLQATGQTWGKRLLRIKIVDLAGTKPSLATLIGKRYLPLHALANVPCLGSLLVLVDCLMIFRDDKRCLHDLVAGTRVVKAR